MRIAVFCLPGIGDGLMATPMIDLLRKKMPDSKIDVITMFEGIKYVFKNNSCVDNVYNLPLYKKNKLIAVLELLKLRKNNYDISILAFPGYRKEYHIVQWLVGAKKRIAHIFNKGYWKEWNFLDTDHVLLDYNIHNVINNMNLLSALKIDWRKEVSENDLTYKFKLDKKDESFGSKFLISLGWDKKEVIGIHPGSTASKAGLYRRWPIKYYKEVIDKIIEKYKKNVIIFAGPEEKELGKELFDSVKNRKHCIFLNNVSFGQAVAVLSKMSLLIANDNGFGHLANALNVFSIILYGSTNPILSAPYNKRIFVSIRKAKFTPWFRNDVKANNPPLGVKSGMESIKPNDVFIEIEKLLQ
jgi:ADP-heptose:LPS heptosyltransferase